MRRGDFKFIANTLNHFRQGMFFGHEVPKNRADGIQGIERIHVANAAANGNDDEFAFNLARDHIMIANKASSLKLHQ